MTERIRQITNNTYVDLVFKVIVTFLVPWCVWVTNNVYRFQAFSQGQRFTLEMGFQMEQRLTQQMRMQESRQDMRINDLPPKIWQDRIVAIEADCREARSDMLEFQKDIAGTYVRKDDLPVLIKAHTQ